MPPLNETERQTLRTAIEQAGGYLHIAEQLGVSRITLYRWLEGQKNPSAENLESLLGLLGLRRVVEKKKVLRDVGRIVKWK